MFSRKTIVKKTMEVGGFTFLSRILGIMREILMVKYLGASALSDAFLTAYKVPNSLRKFFAEGALSAAFVPTLTNTMQLQGREQVKGLISLGFIIFEGIVLILCVIVMLKSNAVIRFIAPGFSIEQINNAAPILKIVMPVIFFLSSSALLAGALQAVGHFFVPAISPVLLNISFISGLTICLSLHLPITYLCWFILFGGLLQFVIHVIAYIKLQFGFGAITKENFKQLRSILIKFFLCLPSISIMELSLFIDTSFASYLPKGSISLVYYANRFVGIPLGVFAVAFSTILLPHFSRLRLYAPKRLNFYLFESAKFVLWVILPIIFLMTFFSEKIFYTIFLSPKFTLSQVQQAAHILRMFLIGLFFFSLNKILLNLYYAMHITWVPALIAAGATIVNVLLDSLFLNWLQASGLALATSISSMVQAFLFAYFLWSKYNIRLYIKPFILFTFRYSIQLVSLFVPFIAFYYIIEWFITTYFSSSIAIFFLYKLGFWLWVGPLSLLLFILLWYLRSYFNVKLFFLD
ncbi:MAG: murein biosynthesis integral membrane protein MurJ [Candidatus Babeliales bacterium]